MNEASFELGNIASESASTEADDGGARRGVLGQRRRRHRLARALAWSLMARYGWTLWASIQDGVSTIDFDFWAWGMEKYDSARAELLGAGLRPAHRSSGRRGRPMTDLPDRARVVVVGGGVGGTSIAHHLAAARRDRRARSSTAAELTSGSTFHSAGLVGQLRGSVTLTRMMMDSAALYRRLAADPDTDPGWVECGGIRLACSPGAHGGARAPGRLGRDVRPAAATAHRPTRPRTLFPLDVDRAGARGDLPGHRRLSRPVAAGVRPGGVVRVGRA